MDIKQLNSQINAVSARIRQVENSAHYSAAEKENLIKSYTTELDMLIIDHNKLALNIDVVEDNTKNWGL